jgi:hypothetical protein
MLGVGRYLEEQRTAPVIRRGGPGQLDPLLEREEPTPAEWLHGVVASSDWPPPVRSSKRPGTRRPPRSKGTKGSSPSHHTAGSCLRVAGQHGVARCKPVRRSRRLRRVLWARCRSCTPPFEAAAGGRRNRALAAVRRRRIPSLTERGPASIPRRCRADDELPAHDPLAVVGLRARPVAGPHDPTVAAAAQATALTAVHPAKP